MTEPSVPMRFRIVVGGPDAADRDVVVVRWSR